MRLAPVVAEKGSYLLQQILKEETEPDPANGSSQAQPSCCVYYPALST